MISGKFGDSPNYHTCQLRGLGRGGDNNNGNGEFQGLSLKPPELRGRGRGLRRDEEDWDKLIAEGLLVLRPTAEEIREIGKTLSKFTAIGCDDIPTRHIDKLYIL